MSRTHILLPASFSLLILAYLSVFMFRNMKKPSCFVLVKGSSQTLSRDSML